MKFTNLTEQETRELSGGGIALGIVGAILGAASGCVAAGINAIVNDDYSTESLTMSIVSFATGGAAIGLVIPAP